MKGYLLLASCGTLQTFKCTSLSSPTTASNLLSKQRFVVALFRDSAFSFLLMRSCDLQKMLSFCGFLAVKEGR